MKSNKKAYLQGYPTLSICFYILLIIIAVITIITVSIDKNKLNDYCSKQYPSQIENSESGTTYEIEEGYVKCFRLYYKEHKLERESKIFRYV